MHVNLAMVPTGGLVACTLPKEVAPLTKRYEIVLGLNHEKVIVKCSRRFGINSNKCYISILIIY